jgi:hypothetical protein
MTRAYAVSHRRFGPQPPPRETNAVRRRADWRDLADKARTAAGLSDAARDADFALHFGHLVAAAGRGEPPFENATDRLCAEALRLLSRAWIDRLTPERRADLADALASAARLVDQLLTEEQDRAAFAWKRRLPEDER